MAGRQIRCGRCSARWGCPRGWRTADHPDPGAEQRYSRRVLDRDLHDCLFDAQRALDEVEVAGLEGDEFTPPESGVDGGLHKQSMLGGKGGEDGDVLLRIQRPGLLLDDLGELGVGAGVEGDHAVAQCAFEDRVQHGVVLPHRRGRETVPVLCGAGGSHPALDLRGQDLAHGPAAEGGDEVLVEVGPVRGEGRGLDLLGGQPDGLVVLGEGDLSSGVVVPGTVADLGFLAVSGAFGGTPMRV
jgi:hypothetical protein